MLTKLVACVNLLSSLPAFGSELNVDKFTAQAEEVKETLDLPNDEERMMTRAEMQMEYAEVEKRPDTPVAEELPDCVPLNQDLMEKNGRSWLLRVTEI